MAAEGFQWQLLLSALSEMAGQHNEQRAARKAQADLDAGRAAAAAEQRKADEMLGQQVDKLRTSDPEEERMRAMADYQVALRRARSGGDASLPANLGGAQFQADSAAANTAGIGYGNQVADIVSRIDAPITQRRLEGESIARTGNEMGRTADRASTEMYLAELRARRRQPNPWVGMLSRIGQSIAQNYEPASRPTLDVEVLPPQLPPAPVRPRAPWDRNEPRNA